MPFLGTIVNFVVVLIAGGLGALLKRGVPERISDTIIKGMSAVVLYIGVSGVLESAPAYDSASFLSDDLRKVLIMILSIAIGTVIGELLNIESALERLGAFVEKKFSPKGEEPGNMAKGFVTCSLLFCVGAMAVTGSIDDAAGIPDIILAKSVIDAITCFTLATTLGIGCALSAFAVLLYQGSITTLAFFAQDLLEGPTQTYMSATGSLIIILVGLNVMGATKIRTANMVPAIFLPLLLEPLFRWIF